jgi:RNA polymerase sigma factor (sigma-70 family)
MTDLDLLREYARTHADAPFAELVRRHIHWVHSAALRQVVDANLAEDVTQSVFIALSRKAGSLQRRRALHAWLFRATRYASATALRSERRRKHHEQRAAAMRSEFAASSAQPKWEELDPLLDQLVARLSRRDQQLVLLRFYQQMTFSGVATVLGISEDAAKKRCERTVEKLRNAFARRGVQLGSSGALTAVLSTQTTVPAHAALLNSTIASAQGLTANTPPFALAKGVIQMMSLSRAGLTGAVLAVPIVIAGIAWAVAINPSDRAAATTRPTPNAATTRPAVAVAPTLAELISGFQKSQEGLERIFVHCQSIVKADVRNARLVGAQYAMADGKHVMHDERWIYIDGSRFSNHSRTWGWLGRSTVDEAHAADQYWIFDGKQYAFVASALGQRPSATLDVRDVRVKEVIDKREGSDLAGTTYAAQVEMLKTAAAHEIRAEYDRDGAVKAWVVDADTPGGKLVIGFDPGRGYNITTLQETIRDGKDTFEGKIVNGGSREIGYDVIEFKQIKDRWVPWHWAASVNIRTKAGGGEYQEKKEIDVQRLEWALNPDFETLRVFTLDAIKEGARVTFISGPGPATIGTWRNGKFQANPNQVRSSKKEVY